MDSIFLASRILSLVAFLGYGTLCITSEHMVADFQRFGLERFRHLTGALEVLGGLGLLAGFIAPRMTTLASGGLALLMLLGVIVRVRASDTLLDTLPAMILLLLNVFICVYSLRG